MQHINQVMAAFIAAIEIEAERRRRVPRNIPDRSNPLEVLSERQVIDRYRIGREEIVLLCEELTEELRRPTARCKAIPVHLQVGILFLPSFLDVLTFSFIHIGLLMVFIEADRRLKLAAYRVSAWGNMPYNFTRMG